MALDLALRQLVGPNLAAQIDGFVELEAGIAATTIIRHLSTLGDAAGDPVAPYPGVIVGMYGASEAGSNFTVQATVDGTPDTGNTMTVNSAAEYVRFLPADYAAFTAGQTVGMYCVADTTSKDFKGGLIVVYDVSGLG